MVNGCQAENVFSSKMDWETGSAVVRWYDQEKKTEATTHACASSSGLLKPSATAWQSRCSACGYTSMVTHKHSLTLSAQPSSQQGTLATHTLLALAGRCRSLQPSNMAGTLCFSTVIATVVTAVCCYLHCVTAMLSAYSFCYPLLVERSHGILQGCLQMKAYQVV